jgi:hypothetical protein
MTNEQWLAVRKLPCRLIQKLRRFFGHYECRRQPSARSCTRGAFARRQSPAGANRHEETDQMSKEGLFWFGSELEICATRSDP